MDFFLPFSQPVLFLTNHCHLCFQFPRTYLSFPLSFSSLTLCQHPKFHIIITYSKPKQNEAISTRVFLDMDFKIPIFSSYLDWCCSLPPFLFISLSLLSLSSRQSIYRWYMGHLSRDNVRFVSHSQSRRIARFIYLDRQRSRAIYN